MTFSSASDVKVGQTWRTEDGYLYRILHVEDEWVYARHPNAKHGTTQILRAWFDEPSWSLVRQA